MKHFILIICSLIGGISCSAQLQFQEYVHDAANPSLFACLQMHTTADTGFVLNGYVDTAGAYLLKADKVGNIQWFKNYDGVGAIYDVEQTSDHGYIALGDDGNNKAVLMKTDSLGNIQWMKRRNGTSWPSGCVHELAGGGYVFSAYFFASGPYIFICRTDAVGNVLWEKSYTISVDLFTSSFLQLTPDGGFIICGTMLSAGGIGLLKIDGSGNIQWQKAYAPGAQHGISVHATGSGYFLSGVGNEHLVILADSVGNVIWARQWSRPIYMSFGEPAYNVVLNGNKLICYGTPFINPPQRTNLVFCLDTAGNTLWSRCYGTFSGYNDVDVVSCRSTPGNGLAFMGLDTAHELFLMNLDSTMIPNCNDSIANFSPLPSLVTYGTATVAGQSLAITYSNFSCITNSRITSTFYNCTPLSTQRPIHLGTVLAFPNPADEKIILQFPSAMEEVTVSIFDLSGRIVDSVTLEAGSEKLELKTAFFEPGLYLWKCDSNECVFTGVFSIQH